jgi:heme/copper-type cytochrome/quinol oxidase subunit 4
MENLKIDMENLKFAFVAFVCAGIVFSIGLLILNNLQNNSWLVIPSFELGFALSGMLTIIPFIIVEIVFSILEKAVK